MLSTPKPNPELAFTLFLFALTTIYLVAALQIRSQFSEGFVGPRFLPLLAAGITYAALLRLLWQKSGGAVDAGGGSFKRPLFVALSTAAFIALFKPLGYPASTVLFVAALLWIFEFGRSNPALVGACAVGVAAVFYLLFGVAFGVRLPLLPLFL